jgi:hypothetical protein
VTTNSPLYMREYRARVGRDRVGDRIRAHLAYWGNRHPYPCRVCAHPCPGKGCLTTIHDPYKVLCSFCGKRT